jgi:hypothetical protein
MTDEASDVLDIQLAYWRAEFEIHEHRLERATTRAAGLVAAALALGGATTTVLAALHRSLPIAAIVCLVLGGVCTVTGAFAGITAADTADEPKWGWKDADTADEPTDEPKRGWKHIELHLLKLSGKTSKLLTDREAMHALMPSPEKTDPILVRRAIVESLETRARAAANVASYTNDQVWFVSVLVLTGVILLAAAVAVVVA